LHKFAHFVPMVHFYTLFVNITHDTTYFLSSRKLKYSIFLLITYFQKFIVLSLLICTILVYFFLWWRFLLASGFFLGFSLLPPPLATRLLPGELISNTKLIYAWHHNYKLDRRQQDKENSGRITKETTEKKPGEK
jgi:hypothetical protein